MSAQPHESACNALPSREIQWLNRDELEPAVAREIQKTRVVLDIGCGLRPQSFFRPQVHLCCEPHGEYVEYLQRAFRREPGAVVIQSTAGELLPKLPERSVDSVFMLDVIEHLTRKDGLELLRESERVARRQIVLFTPLGFLPQDYDDHDIDGWGLNGGRWQRHLSGWTPDDFPAHWKFFACRDFHTVNGKGEVLDCQYGAFWAVKNISTYAARWPRLMVVSPTLPPDKTPSARTITRAFASYPGQQLTFLSTRDYSAYTLLQRVPENQAAPSVLESSNVRLQPTLDGATFPTWLRRGTEAVQLRQCRQQVIREAKSACPQAVLATTEARTELRVAAAAARKLRLPFIAIVPEGTTHPVRRFFRSSRQRALASADVVWTLGDPEAAAAAAQPGQLHTGTTSIIEVLEKVGLTAPVKTSAGPSTTADAA